jgi:hypothetical protein
VEPAWECWVSINALLLFGVVFIKWAMAAQPYL